MFFGCFLKPGGYRILFRAKTFCYCMQNKKIKKIIINAKRIIIKQLKSPYNSVAK